VLRSSVTLHGGLLGGPHPIHLIRATSQKNELNNTGVEAWNLLSFISTLAQSFKSNECLALIP